MKDLNYASDIEVSKHQPLIRHFLFGLTTISFFTISFFSIQDLILKKPLFQSNIIYFIIFVVALASIWATIIINLSKYSDIKKIIQYSEGQEARLNVKNQTFNYTKTVWIYPLVSFIYFIILIIFLIIVNHKCFILKNNISYYYNF